MYHFPRQNRCMKAATKRKASRGSFAAGWDPRRGTSLEKWQLVHEARKLAPAALTTLRDVMMDKSAPVNSRILCAQEILNRSHGRAPVSVELSIDSKPRDIRTLTNDELMQLAQGITIEGVVIDQATLPALEHADDAHLELAR